MNKKIINAVVFQVGWFICILLDATYAVIFTSLALVFHIAYITESSRRMFELCFIGVMLIVGAMYETAYLMSHVLVTDTGKPLPPIWLLMLWLLFATTLNHSLSWLVNRPWLAGLLTAIAAPWSYYAGVQLKGNIGFGMPVWLSLLVIALSWSLLMITTYRYLAKVTSKQIENFEQTIRGND